MLPPTSLAVVPGALLPNLAKSAIQKETSSLDPPLEVGSAAERVTRPRQAAVSCTPTYPQIPHFRKNPLPWTLPSRLSLLRSVLRRPDKLQRHAHLSTPNTY
ncbi:hypothetical protein B0H11DRAFT_2248586 [Mycena galericulata]|nr:hypothetical protein B0H11DRAFT_2248586 [Mycena galericulata]